MKNLDKNVKGRTKIVGILNVTPDSFFDGGKYLKPEAAIRQGVKMANDGADYIDIGAESTRPGSEAISEEIELQRVLPVIEGLKKEIDIPLAIDTKKPGVAKAAIELGVAMINDVSGFSDPKMCELAAQSPEVDLCVMHMQKNPLSMQKNPIYPKGVINEIEDFFDSRCKKLISYGVDPKRIILDPGIGFGKTVAHNLEILHNLQKLKLKGFRLYVGISRKSFMTKLLNLEKEQLLDSTLILNSLFVSGDVDFIRVHDVLEHRRIIDLVVNG